MAAAAVTAAGAAASKKARSSAPKTPSVAAPSASVVVVSPQNEILLLHRVQSGTFSSAHVFPGGNLSRFHEGALIPAVDSAARHADGPAYRLAAIRETFEESGVLLARPLDAGSGGASPLLRVSDATSRRGRLSVANEQCRFQEWLAGVGGTPDTDHLIPFTRWVTPPNLARRYTTQMYLYLLPPAAATATTGGPPRAVGGHDAVDDAVDDAAAASSSSSSSAQPTADLTEVMAAEFASAPTWVRRARQGEIILFPPQFYILSLLAPVLRGPEGLPAGATAAEAAEHYAAEREALAELLRSGGGGGATEGGEGAAQCVPWADRVMSPRLLGKMPDGRTVLALDRPGPELRDSGRGGDAQRVVLVGNLPPGPPRDLELRWRKDVMPALAAQAKAAQAKAAAAAAAGSGSSRL